MSSFTSKKNEFVKTISDQPYYRILAYPDHSNGQFVSTDDEKIREILHKPPKKRFAGFGVTGLWEKETYEIQDGIKGSNITGGEITLHNDGYFEVTCPINYSQFQRGCGSPQFAIPKSVKWLYPYVVIEFPVSFIRLLKDIYDVSGNGSGVNIDQEYYNIKDYALPEGPPTFPTFGAFIDERGVYEKATPLRSNESVTPEEWVDPSFLPDRVAYALVTDVYNKFGITDQRVIPAFDENKNFILI